MVYSYIVSCDSAGFGPEYFQTSEDVDPNKTLLEGYKSVLHSKQTEESLVSFYMSIEVGSSPYPSFIQTFKIFVTVNVLINLRLRFLWQHGD